VLLLFIVVTFSFMEKLDTATRSDTRYVCTSLHSSPFPSSITMNTSYAFYNLLLRDKTTITSLHLGISPLAIAKSPLVLVRCSQVAAIIIDTRTQIHLYPAWNTHKTEGHVVDSICPSPRPSLGHAYWIEDKRVKDKEGGEGKKNGNERTNEDYF